MARSINTEDTWRERLLKHIPSEIVGVYLAIQAVIPDEFAPHLVFALLCLVTVPLWLSKFQEVKASRQLLLSTFAFIIWVSAIGGPFQFISAFEGWMATAAVIFYSGIFAPLVGKQTPPAPAPTS
jgi:hypothetical protein